MTHRNKLLNTQWMPESRRELESSQKSPFSPRTIMPSNTPSLNLLSQLKHTKLLSSRINYLIQPEDEFGSNNRIITMFSSADGSIHAHDETATILQRYASNEIAFIGIWGSRDSDKSFFYDRVFELCDVKDSKYCATAEEIDASSLIYFYERPFVKNNIRIFLLDCRGYRDHNNLTKEQKIQLDILMALCQIIVLAEKTPEVEPNVRPKDIVEVGYEHFNASFKRLYLDKNLRDLETNQISWPMSLLLLFDSSKSIKRHQSSDSYQEELQKMFQDYNFSVLHNASKSGEQNVQSYITINNPLDELYSKNSSTIFKDMYEKIHKKTYMGMKYTGYTCPHVISQLAYSANKSQAICFPRTYEKAKVSTYASLYNRQALAYLIKLKPHLQEQKSYNTDHLLGAFKECREETMQEYDDLHYEISVGNKNDDLYASYENKLDEYIDEKEKNILSVNYKKSMKELTSARPPILEAKSVDVHQDYGNLVSAQRDYKLKCDANADASTAGNVLKSLFRAKVDPISDSNSQVLQDKRTIVYRRKQEIETLLKTKMKTTQDYEQSKQKDILNLKKKSDYFSEEIRKIEQTIKNTRKYANTSSNERDRQDESRLIMETRTELEDLKERHKNKLKILEEVRAEMNSKSQKEKELEKRLQSKQEQAKKDMMRSSIVSISALKGRRGAEVRQVVVPGSKSTIS